MKKFLLPALFALILTACGESSTISMTGTFVTGGKDDKAELILATKSIAERRLARLDADLVDFDVTYNDDNTADISISGSDKEAMQQLLMEMTTPFVIELRLEAEEFQEGDIEVENLGFFRTTGIGNEDISWVLSRTMEGALEQGEVMIQFTEQGATKMQELFAGNVGKSVGLFIRGQLTANFAIQSENFGTSIVIPNVPSPELAKIFADDMNVGINMTFSSDQ